MIFPFIGCIDRSVGAPFDPDSKLHLVFNVELGNRGWLAGTAGRQANGDDSYPPRFRSKLASSSRSTVYHLR